MNTLNKKPIFSLVLLILCAANGAAQTAPDAPVKRVNFLYSQNPKTKNQSRESAARNAQPTENVGVAAQPEKNTATVSSVLMPDGEAENNSIAKKTFEIARRSNGAATSPTEIYKIGVGDVLFISLQNAPAKASTYFTVLNDGTIDYPLAGEMIAAAGLTADEIADALKEKVKLYANPQISVSVRENSSHSISVLGLVEKAGEKFLQREAVPLYVIKAEAVVEPRADTVFIKRANSQTEIVDLKDSKSEDVLIFTGDILEFKSSGATVADASNQQFYFIGGEIMSAGQKEFHAGLTLTQAILACGGLRRSGVKKAVIRRKNEHGLLSPIQFDLNAVRDGKQPDPILQAGDTIELIKF